MPRDPREILAQEFAKAAREETAKDEVTGQTYRVNHVFSPDDNGQVNLWININEAPRPIMLKSLEKRREQMVDDGVGIKYDEGRWNRINPDEDPINLPMDITPDIDWRMNSED